MCLLQKRGLLVTCHISHNPRKSFYAVYLESLEMIMMWESGTEPCSSTFLELGKSLQRWLETESCRAYLARQRLYANTSDSLDSMWQPPRIFFCYSAQETSKANHEHILQMCVKAQLTSPVLPWRFSFSSLLYSLPQTMTHGIIKSCQLNFSKSLSQSWIITLPFLQTLIQERKWAEKKRKRAVTAVWSKEQTL